MGRDVHLFSPADASAEIIEQDSNVVLERKTEPKILSLTLILILELDFSVIDVAAGVFLLLILSLATTRFMQQRPKTCTRRHLV